jgi:NAD(P)-dependent dehydrogenase (short-subunit alcohol dehydrogenase family)
VTANNKFVPLSDLIKLTGKKALVTGAGMGIGFAIAYRLAEAGAHVTVVDFNEEKGHQAVDKLVSYGFKASFLRCNVGIEEEVKNTVVAAAAGMGGLDILVNNAGIYPFFPVLEMTAENFEKVLSVNLKGLFYFSREAGRLMAAKNSGVIVNVASIDAIHPSAPGLAAYDASKGGVQMLTKSMALELGKQGIRVNAIAPGSIMTEGAIAQGQASGSTRETTRAFMVRIPLDRMGVADDIGRVALFLASDLASYMTGCTVVADGGYLLS